MLKSHFPSLHSFTPGVLAAIGLGLGCLSAPAAPEIIIKADDVGVSGPNVEASWQRFVDYIEANDLKATIGIVLDSLENPNDAYIQWVLEQHNSGRIEFFHHGYDHSRDATSWEFRNRDYLTQKFNFDRGMELAKEKLGITLRTFGAPYNQTDTSTERILVQDPDMKIWLYPPGTVTDSSLALLRRIGAMNIEQSTGVVSSEPFITNYPTYADEEVLVLQCHPAAWNEDSWTEFEKIVGLLKNEGANFTTPTAYTERWRSELYPESWRRPDETVSFETDKLIQDFSFAGYQRGEQPIPRVNGPIFDVTDYGADPSGTEFSSLEIQAAIDAAAAAGGGVVYMPAGQYRISPGPLFYSLWINSSNIVLRGAGVDKTFLLNSSYEMRSKTVIQIGPTDLSEGEAVAITADLTGPTQRIPVADAAAFSAGDIVKIQWDFTLEWIAEHGQEAFWNETVGPKVSYYYREILSTNPEEGWIEIDVPTRYVMKVRDNARVRKATGMIHDVGLESFSIGNIQHPGSEWGSDDYADSSTAAFDTHASYLIKMQNLRDSWISDIHSRQHEDNTTTAHMLSNGILLRDSFRSTVRNCDMRRPQYGGGGGNGYMYRLSNSHECLVRDSIADFSRHGVVVSNPGTSGNVFLRCEDRNTQRAVGSSPSGYTTSGAGSDNHMHFSHSNLWDQCHAHDSFYTASHRGNAGTAIHGLSSAHGVYWNTSGSGTRYTTIVRSEQGRYGYIIGTSGSQFGALNPTGGNTEPADHMEGIGDGASLEPQSLYLDQLDKRLDTTVTYNGNGATGGTAPVDPNNPYDSGATVAVLGQGDLQRTGFTFSGWNTDPDGRGTAYSAGDTFVLTERMVLYAQWTGPLRLITFDANGGSTPAPQSKSVRLEESYGTLPDTSLAGYSLVGWFTAPSGGQLVTADTLNEINADHTLYAQWNALPLVDAGEDQDLMDLEETVWTPANLVSQAWFDASDADSLTVSNGSVSQWNDKSGNGNHVAQENAANQPSVGTASIGGLDVVSFRLEQEQHLLIDDNPSLDLDATGGVNIFAVFKFLGYVDQGSGLNVPFSKGPILGAAASYGIRVSNSNGLSFKAAVDSMTTRAGPISQNLLYGGTRNDVASETTMYYNGLPQQVVSGGTLESDNDHPMIFGRDTATTRYADFDVGELLLVGGLVSEQDRQQIEGYLAHKWGLEASLNVRHPYRNAPPSSLGNTLLQGSVSDPEGDDLTHSWSLVSGPAGVLFEDASSLETTVSFSEMGVYVFRLTSSDGFGSVSNDTTVIVGEIGVPLEYAFWSGNESFDQDSNFDGVADGVVWLLGGESPLEPVDSLVQKALLADGSLDIRFLMLNEASRASAVLELQYSSDLGQWTTVTVPESSGTVNGVAFTISPDGDLNAVELNLVPSGSQGETFIRLTGRLN